MKPLVLSFLVVYIFESICHRNFFSVLQHADKRAMSAYAPYQHYMPPYMYPYPMPPPYYTAPPAAYHRNYMVPSMYAAHSLPVAVRHDAPSCSWGQESVRDADRRDENISGRF